MTKFRRAPFLTTEMIPYLCVALCSIAACVLPNGTWAPAPRQHQPPHSEDVEDQPSVDRSGGSWICSAKATLQESSDGGSWDDSPISSVGGGNTRDDASYEAFSNCNSLVTLEMTQAQIAERRVLTDSECHITDCIGR